VIEFGDVTNDGSSNALDSDSMIYVEWDAVTIDTIQNNTEYWVSAGVQYNNEDEIWIGQASFMSLLDDYSSVRIRMSTLYRLLCRRQFVLLNARSKTSFLHECRHFDDL